MLPLLLVPYYLMLGLIEAHVGNQIKTNFSKYKIVGFNSGLSVSETQEVLETYSLKVKKNLPLINACLCEIQDDGATLRSLAQDDTIEFIEDDYEGSLQVMPALPFYITQISQEIPWGVQKIGAPGVWNETRGRGVRVGIIDSGVDITHPDLKDNIKEVGTVLGSEIVTDEKGHGTHVAGTIAALDNNIGVVGAAPNVEIYAVKAFNKSGSGNISSVVEAIDWCIERRVHVINMSFGFFNNSKALEKAIQEAYRHKITLVAASGNFMLNNIVMYPAKYPEVIAVAASNSNDGVAWFSSGGPEVDVMAPGTGILSTYKGGGYKTDSGTSMAAPHVTGTVALILSKTRLSPAGVKEVLKTSAKDLGYSKVKQGSGLVNVPEALLHMK